MMKKFFIVFFALVCALCLAFGVTACGGNDDLGGGTDGGGTSDGNDSESGHVHTYGTDNICTECGYNLEYTEGLTYYGLTSGSSVYAYMYCGGGENAAGDITIAAYYNGLPVTEVLLGGSTRIEDWFLSQMANGSVTEEDYIEFLENCYGQEVTGITIPDGVTNVEFNGYGNLVSANISETVEYFTAYSCENLKDINIPCYVQSVYLSYCPALETETENGITYYKNCVMGCDENLTRAEIREGATAINQGAFNYSNIKEVVIPSSMKYICEGSFEHCSSLTGVTLSDGVEYIGSYAFGSCTSLTSVTIPSSVSGLGWTAFIGCYKLVEVYNLSSLDITAGSSENGFVGYYALNVYNSTDEESRIFEQDGYMFVYDGENNYYLFGYAGTDTDLVLPDLTVDGKNIGYKLYDYAFYRNDVITSVAIGSGVTSIGNFAFFDCVLLANVTIGDGVTSIGYGAFGECSALLSVVIGNGVTTIGDNAFFDCTSLESVAIGSGVTSIGNFAFSGCSSLKSIVIPDSVITIGNSAFYYCTSLESAVIGSGVTTIGASTFSGCTSLESITIPDGVTYIGDGAFKRCSSLKYYEYENGHYLGNEDNNYVVLVEVIDYSVESFSVNENTKFIGEEAFRGCTSLKSVTIGYGLTAIGYGAFAWCSSLESITIPDSVTYLGNWTFYGCTSLESVVLGSGLTFIENQTFEDCTSLTSITIPDGVNFIGILAFYGCTSLESVTFENTDGWYVTTEIGAADGTDADVTDETRNATYLTDTYYTHYWYRSEN